MALIWEAEDMFDRIEFKKRGSEYKRAALKKVKQLVAKIKEREGRIVKIKKEFAISDGDLVELLSKFIQNPHQGVTYSTSNATQNKAREQQTWIPAGVLNNILTERQAIENERYLVKRLGLLSRNINTRKEHTINWGELEFLDF